LPLAYEVLPGNTADKTTLREFLETCAPVNRADPPMRHREWRRVSPSAELLVDPECRARGIIRDTRARGADRFHWSVLAPDQSHTVAAGHTGRIARGTLAGRGGTPRLRRGLAGTFRRAEWHCLTDCWRASSGGWSMPSII